MLKASIKLACLFLLFLAACNNANDITNLFQTNTSPIVIHIQPLGNVPIKSITFLKQELTKIYPHVIINKTIPLPVNAYYAPRARYRADSIIKYLAQTTAPNTVTLGVVACDISTGKGLIKDYGVMGLVYRPGKSCVVSSFRLSKKNTLEQLVKLVAHELGHTQGLPHCSTLTCFMRDAEGKNYTNEMTHFCNKCKSHLLFKGWLLNN
jgi:archaemetzincin